MLQIVNAAATMSFAETPSIAPVNCQNFNWSHPLLTKTPHSTDSVIVLTYRKIKEVDVILKCNKL
jgi:hypothetical protein